MSSQNTDKKKPLKINLNSLNEEYFAVLGWNILERQAKTLKREGKSQTEIAFEAMRELGLSLINGFYGPYKMKMQMPNRYWSITQMRYLADLPLAELEANFGTFQWCVVYPKNNHKLPKYWDQVIKDKKQKIMGGSFLHVYLIPHSAYQEQLYVNRERG